MLKQQDEIFIINFFDMPALGKGIKDVFHPHVTFLAHVLCDDVTMHAKILREVEEIAKYTQPFSLHFESLEHFGVNKDKPVAQLGNTISSQNLHANLLEGITSFGLPLSQPFYAGDNFQPHMTLGSYRELDAMGVHTVETLTVVLNRAGDENQVEVLGNFCLKTPKE